MLSADTEMWASVHLPPARGTVHLRRCDGREPPGSLLGWQEFIRNGTQGFCWQRRSKLTLNTKILQPSDVLRARRRCLFHLLGEELG